MIDRQLSHNLDRLRGFSALYIVVYHYWKISPVKTETVGGARWIFNLILGCGQEVVIFFFILSGFLSFLSYTKNPNIYIGSFLKKRFIRIYPLYILCILFSCSVYYFTTGKLTNGATIAGNLFLLQDAVEKPGNWFRCAGGNLPIWYLSFQWWDYVMFVVFAKLIKQYTLRLNITFCICILGMVSYYIYPNQLSNIIWYYWIFEVGCYLGMCYSNNQSISWKMPLSIVALIVLWLILVLPSSKYTIGAYPLIEVRHFVDVLLGLIIISLCKRFNINNLKIFKPFEIFARWSYSIYLFHFPCLILINSLLGNSLLTACIGFPIVLLLAYLLEGYFQPILIKYFNSK